LQENHAAGIKLGRATRVRAGARRIRHLPGAGRGDGKHRRGQCRGKQAMQQPLAGHEITIAVDGSRLGEADTNTSSGESLIPG
jgi:hypothetical protein